MLRKPTNTIKDVDLRDHLDFIHQEAMGNILELDAVPTATSPLLSDNEIGRYSNILYIRKGSQIYVITPGSTITIL